MSDDAGYDVTVQVQIDADELPLTRLEHAVTWVLRRHNIALRAGVSVVITDDESIQRLNHQFRAIDRPTDVLSFPADPSPVPDDDASYLGDLILALPYIQRQAAAENHVWMDEITLAVVHGTLHLLGYDHDTPVNQTRMWTIQAEALVALNVPITVPEFTFDDAAEGDEPCA